MQCRLYVSARCNFSCRAHQHHGVTGPGSSHRQAPKDTLAVHFPSGTWQAASELVSVSFFLAFSLGLGHMSTSLVCPSLLASQRPQQPTELLPSWTKGQFRCPPAVSGARQSLRRKGIGDSVNPSQQAMKPTFTQADHLTYTSPLLPMTGAAPVWGSGLIGLYK